jgi:hypothetical protein
MKIYLAATMQNDFRRGSQTYARLDDREKAIVDGIPHRLDSYHYIGNDRLVKRIRDTGVRIFLDSGAFSAYTQGVTIDINRYCRYCRDNADILEQISVLDAIGDANQTYHNQKYMEAQGVQALPCYHYGEPEAVLRYYVDNYAHITIGGMVPISSPQLKLWLDRLWSKILTNPDGTAKVKVHGFGLTSVPLMARYPWYSVDSSSWVQLGGMGNIFIPQWGMLAVSEFSPNAKEKGKHIDTLTPVEQEAVIRLINEWGFDVERLRKEHLSRKVFNALTYTSIMDADNDHLKRFTQYQPTLF